MLLSLFAVCLACSNSTVACIKVITGTFVQVQQLCRSCGHKRLWNSQPYIGNVPAGNLLLSTAILCAGALPSMVLRVLKYLKCSSICKDTFLDTRRPTCSHAFRQSGCCTKGHSWVVYNYKRKNWLLLVMAAQTAQVTLQSSDHTLWWTSKWIKSSRSN